jgi:hypothetical protein
MRTTFGASQSRNKVQNPTRLWWTTHVRQTQPKHIQTFHIYKPIIIPHAIQHRPSGDGDLRFPMAIPKPVSAHRHQSFRLRQTSCRPPIHQAPRRYWLTPEGRWTCGDPAPRHVTVVSPDDERRPTGLFQATRTFASTVARGRRLGRMHKIDMGWSV